MTLWEVDIYPAAEEVDRSGQAIASDAAELGIVDQIEVDAVRGYLIEGELSAEQAQKLASQLLSDPLVERTLVGPVGADTLTAAPRGQSTLVHVMPKPGVMDPVAQSTLAAIQDLGLPAKAVRTFKKYWLSDLAAHQLESLCRKVLANDSIEQVVVGPLKLDQLEVGGEYTFELRHVPIRSLDDQALMQLSREGQLYLSLVEMQTIQTYFKGLERDPTDVELETIAQTWSEHCSHKTLAGRIAYRDEHGSQQFENMLKETIFAATQTIRSQLGERDWCISVFEDNAGVVQFNDDYHVVFKVETHNHPSALEPYGGANTGIGGVIRDPLGTGMGAKPICNTDVFCFADPRTPADALPDGVLHPRRVMKGVVSGVRDYGNRMGIPTVNGAIYFDPRYLGNPLVYCGNVGLLPTGKVKKQPEPGDWIVALGGRTGRDGIHGATFSSAELTSESESLSGGAVQIGNAITEKMLMDVLLEARDRGLYHAVTDCGAGGFSSAVGEMGEKIGAEVYLDRAPLKYQGLSYTEIWISEAQERMVLAVPGESWEEFQELCESESVEATIIGKFVPTGRLALKYGEHQVADLEMAFLHDGRPPIIREATYQPPAPSPWAPEERSAYTDTLKQLLGCLNIASKEWVIRQYDHEVQGGSVIKPLVGVCNDGPSDAAVVRPLLNSNAGIAVSCGMNPHYGDLDPYHMAASAIDEALRNCVAVGANPERIAILDNFCWGYTDRAETLGSLVRAALACRDIAVAMGTPFISGKDSLNNEFRYTDSEGQEQTIAIPSTLLISALGLVADVEQCVTMDLKAAGNRLYQLGTTYAELGGSHLALLEGGSGGTVPQVRVEQAKANFAALYSAIQHGFVRSCHDLSEGGLAVALAEMAFAGGLGVDIDLSQCPSQLPDCSAAQADIYRLFAESNSRFLVEVAEQHVAAFESLVTPRDCQCLGTVSEHGRVVIRSQATSTPLVDEEISQLKACWQQPLNWNG